MGDFTENKNVKPPSKLLKTLLFFANWLFVLALSKKLISSPRGELDFVAKNIGAFLVATVLTGLMIHFSPRKVMTLLIPIMVILALAIGSS